MAEWIAEYKYRRHDEINDVINDVYKFTCSDCGWQTGQQGISFQYCPHCGKQMTNANCPTVIPKVKIDKILSEIPNLVHWQSPDGQDLVMAYDVIRLIKENIS